MPRAALLLLHDLEDVGREARDDLRDLLAAVTDHGDGAVRPEACDGGQRVADEREPADLVQDLGALGAHAGAGTGSEDDGGDVGRLVG
ncbi:hypothetical protein GCM10009710_19200 [Aeromicrobium alkaliterrae]|uniref:Uncharacterized protein n=1 Tax=Aeromicrobium alkaliterrae TaxID=302168 RepID=A0ABN2JUZ5_9ACTN